MRKVWAHPEYRPVLAANAAGVMPVGGGWIELLEAWEIGDNETPRDGGLSSRTATRILMSVFCFSCLVALLGLDLCISGASKNLSATVAAESALDEFDAEKVRLVTNKKEFLARLSADKRNEIAGNTHYIAEVISGKEKGISEDTKKLALAIVVESMKADVDPLFVAAIIKQESTFKLSAVSNKGAKGLMQILPETGRYISRKSDLDWTGKLHDPEYNIRLGVAYLNYLKKSFRGNIQHALIAYNWGPGKLNGELKSGQKIPSSPLSYAQKVISAHEKWRHDLDRRMASYKYLNVDSMFS